MKLGYMHMKYQGPRLPHISKTVQAFGSKNSFPHTMQAPQSIPGDT